jgi:hypothetical protein
MDGKYNGQHLDRDYMLGGFIGSWHGLMAPILLPDIQCLDFRYSLPVCGEK